MAIACDMEDMEDYFQVICTMGLQATILCYYGCNMATLSLEEINVMRAAAQNRKLFSAELYDSAMTAYLL